MYYFAKLDENNLVVDVNTLSESVITDAEVEIGAITYLTSWSNGHTNWKQTWPDSSFRKNYAGIGFTYDSERDAFIAPSPFPSWQLDEETCQWNPPTPRPNDGLAYLWNETELAWELYA